MQEGGGSRNLYVFFSFLELKKTFLFGFKPNLVRYLFWSPQNVPRNLKYNSQATEQKVENKLLHFA